MTASLDDVTSATSEIETSGIKDALFTIKVDVNDSTFISQAAQYVSATYGYLDVPINNAAVGAQDPDIRTRMQAAMETNVVGPAVVAYSGRLVRIYIVDEMKNIQMRGVCPAADPLHRVHKDLQSALEMPGFVDSFWSPDYAGGLGVLFQKLQQGVTENHQVLTIASMRADAEEAYSDSLSSIAPSVDRMSGGFARDDGASLRKAYEGVRGEMVEASKNHQKIAQNIRELVVNPFSRWCDAHALRVQNSQDDLQSKIKAHDRQAELVKKLRSQYFNKCRLVEDLEEENKLAFQEPEKQEHNGTSTGSSSPPPKIVLPGDEVESLPVEIGDESYMPEQLKALLMSMLNLIPIRETKVPILGTYQNTSAGTDIVDFIQKSMKAPSVGYAEKIGQDLIERGFLRLVGNVGSAFANSSRMKYQWRPRAWQVAGVPERKKALGRTGTASSLDGLPESPAIGNITETLQAWNPLNNPYPNETPSQRLKREAKESDERYKASVKRLDILRCNLEESMMDHLKFLERCELDRLKAIRSVVLDFSGAISNSIPSFQSQVDNMMLYQETIQPLSDLRYMLENYRTGMFIPRVTPYENYYGSVDDQTFGVDLEARARADRKRVPILITTILTFLDTHYPDLEGDEARRNIWLVDVPLTHTHHLRNAISHSNPIPREAFEQYDMPVVASVLKLYLLELPDSLVSSQIYEIIKTIYTTTPDAAPNPISSESQDSSPRIKVLQSTLGQLRLNNIATLDAITTHFTRLIDLTSADDEYVSKLATAMAPCILRPKTENSLHLEEKFAYRLIRDLFDHKEAIFGELKRQSSALGNLSGSSNVNNPIRSRAVSNADESNRRANMEARAKAINEQRTRDKSPGPANRHRREVSTGRFPVVASPRPDASNTATRNTNATLKRESLEVPGSHENSPVTSGSGRSLTQTQPPAMESQLTTNGTTNGNSTPKLSHAIPSMFTGGGPGPHIPPPVDDDQPADESSESQQETVSSPTSASTTSSIKRSALGSGGKRPVRPGGGSLGGLKRNASRDLSSMTQADSPTATRSTGVTLEDKPMEDFA